MGIELLFLGVALALVGITGGSYKKLFSTKVNHWWALIPVLIGLLVVEFAPIKESQYDTIGISILLGTYVFLYGFLWANLNLKGMWIVLVGLTSNAMVIALNLGMPVTTSGDYKVVESIKHQPETSSDLMGFLGDIIPINFASIAISIGDIIFALGICTVFVIASRKGKLEVEENETEVVANEASSDVKHKEIDIETEKIKAEISEVKSELGNEVTTVEAVHEPAPAPKEKKKKLKEPDVVIDIREEPVLSRKARKWRKKHGLNALPSKEELGFNEESMEVVEVAK